MDIKLSMKDKKDTPDTKIYHGNFALEQMFKDVAEKYFGLEVAKEIQEILSKKITEDEINQYLNKEVDLKKISDTDFRELMRKKI
jgi:methyl coenzyme M reductase alpha subunit